MRIVEVYSHLNGEEFLLVHHRSLYGEINCVIAQVHADQCRTKVSEEKTMKGKRLYSPHMLNAGFASRARGRWLAGRPVRVLRDD